MITHHLSQTTTRTPVTALTSILAVCGLVAASVVTTATAAEQPARQHVIPMHAIAMHGTPAEAPGFKHFRYTNPDSPKGGRVTLGVSGSFDSLNPLIVRGVAAAGVREFVVESLLARGYDEPFSLYGLLAESIEVPDDRSAITFHLDSLAAFSDGRPVTPADVLFSFEVLRERGRPNYRTYYKKVATAEQLGERAVRFVFKPDEPAEGTTASTPKFDREMPLIMGLMPVLARHQFDADSFERTSLEPFVSSGPYTFGRIDRGRSITYTRNPNYWGRDLPVNRGRFNFDEVRYDYYRDASVMIEEFKTGHIDIRPEEDPARWAEGYKVPALGDGRIIKREFDVAVPAGMTALAFNTRRDMFKDPRVRRAAIRWRACARCWSTCPRGWLRSSARAAGWSPAARGSAPASGER